MLYRSITDRNWDDYLYASLTTVSLPLIIYLQTYSWYLLLNRHEGASGSLKADGSLSEHRFLVRFYSNSKDISTLSTRHCKRLCLTTFTATP